MNPSVSLRLLWAILLGVLLLRLGTLGLYPLMDTSEARYAEIARKMLVSNDWITPMFDHDVPFWGKPPLSFWVQALSMKVLGIQEFASRFSSWLLHVASCLLIVHFARQERSLQVGLIAAIIYSTCTLGFLSSGAVLTDVALAFALTLAHLGMWRGLMHGDRGWALAGFFGLGLGLLAKGPLALVLIALPAAIWLAITAHWRRLLGLPWLRGGALTLAVALPWYWLAEQKTPGFLEYFIVGEHLSRYVISQWQGDLYGSAHAEPIGMIWLHLLGGLMPWALFLPLLVKLRGQLGAQPEYFIFVMAWAISAPLFFTMSTNILWTYILPTLPAWSVLLADVIYRHMRPAVIVALALALPLAGCGLIISGKVADRPQNQKAIVALWKAQQAATPGDLIYLGSRSYSAEFYSAGWARHSKSLQQLPKTEGFYLVQRLDKLQPLPPTCHTVGQANGSQLHYCRAVEL
ncbi:MULTISPECIES: glycosyltransferase family 39 protein [unclassified Pseudomonas]|uniref:ArnT family glycosyltransferase n=1 Tax=unclassified Pseudomonas TaxID=196821 RepID=UPI0015BC4FB7|nr:MULTISPECIES: glycosyltransferase family 39 protein [unclassified Pseudomonas]MCS4246655.1 4-amino-4-deoxy-L-arabinose transferase-like glycosyltransferase [Pseudomonas sp. BIGb0164]NWE18280.1 glycosyltransferase family 39 protein [Pseudomonas sp. P7548]